MALLPRIRDDPPPPHIHRRTTALHPAASPLLLGLVLFLFRSRTTAWPRAAVPAPARTIMEVWGAGFPPSRDVSNYIAKNRANGAGSKRLLLSAAAFLRTAATGGRTPQGGTGRDGRGVSAAGCHGARWRGGRPWPWSRFFLPLSLSVARRRAPQGVLESLAATE